MFEATSPARVALVTGAAGGGVGTCTARTLAQSGFAVAVHGRDATAVAQVVAGIERAGGQAAGFLADLSDPAAPGALVTQVRDRLGPITAFVHNAADGVAHCLLEDLTLEAWRRDQSVILEAAFLLSAQVLSDMRRAGAGRIVFVSSSAALRGSFGRAGCYAAAKAGLAGLATQIAVEYGPHGVTANVVAPSQIDTPRIRRNGRRSDAQLAARGASFPLRRVGRPEDVARTIDFLCSEAAGYMTGMILPIDGGSRLAGGETKTHAPKEVTV